MLFALWTMSKVLKNTSLPIRRNSFYANFWYSVQFCWCWCCCCCCYCYIREVLSNFSKRFITHIIGYRNELVCEHTFINLIDFAVHHRLIILCSIDTRNPIDKWKLNEWTYIKVDTYCLVLTWYFFFSHTISMQTHTHIFKCSESWF